MKTSLKFVAMGALALLILIPAAFAQTPETSVLSVTEPLDVGGTILQPGEYTIRVMKSFTDRNKVQVTSPDMRTVYATVLTIPHALGPNEESPNTTFVFYPAAEGSLRALRTWFAPNPAASGGGHDIVYDAARARQLAALAKAPVTAYPATTAVADLDTTRLEVVTMDPVVTPAPMISSQTPEMPGTASSVPLIALLGLISLGGAFAVRMART